MEGGRWPEPVSPAGTSLYPRPPTVRYASGPVTVNLRRALAVFEVGFAVESASGFAALAFSGGSQLPFHGVLVFLSPVFSLFGILFLWVGRHEWNEVHRARVTHANIAFSISIVATVIAGASVGYLAFTGAPSTPGWLALVFGIAVAIIFSITFVTYALVAAHLVGPVGEISMGIGLAWAVLLSALIGLTLMPELHPIANAIVARSASVGVLIDPISLFDALLGLSYLAFFVAFLDAHRRVARGLTPG